MNTVVILLPGSCYLLLTGNRMDWTRAKETCERLAPGAELASIRDADENTFAAGLFIIFHFILDEDLNFTQQKPYPFFPFTIRKLFSLLGTFEDK